jgi:hypothetical protein
MHSQQNIQNEGDSKLLLEPVQNPSQTQATEWGPS